MGPGWGGSCSSPWRAPEVQLCSSSSAGLVSGFGLCACKPVKGRAAVLVRVARLLFCRDVGGGPEPQGVQHHLYWSPQQLHQAASRQQYRRVRVVPHAPRTGHLCPFSSAAVNGGHAGFQFPPFSCLLKLSTLLAICEIMHCSSLLFISLSSAFFFFLLIFKVL